MAKRRHCFLFLVLAFASASASEKWVEVKSPNFRVISDGTEKQARSLAIDFERMRLVVPKVLVNFKMDLPRPLLVVALRNENSLLKLAPKYGDVGGFYGKADEKDYAVVRLDIPVSAGISYSAYVHELLAANFPRVPPWLSIGLPLFFANSRFEKERVLVGAPGQEVRGLRSAHVYSLTNMVQMESQSSAKLDWPRMILFNDESWAVTHFLFFGEGMNRGQKFGAYLSALRNGDDPVKAFEAVFGNPADMEIQFNQYLKKLSYESFAVQPQTIDESALSSRDLPDIEIDAELKGVREYISQREKDAKKKAHN